MKKTGKLNLLFATDFSPNSQKAMPILRLLSDTYGGQIYLFHAIASFWRNFWRNGIYQKEAMQRLVIWQQNFLAENDPSKLIVEIGNPADIVTQIVKRRKIDLIVLAEKNQDAKSRYNAGTTCEAIVRTAPTSVWICKNKVVSNILCGIDGSALSLKTLAWADDLAGRFNAKLHIVSALPCENWIALGMSQQEIKKVEAELEEQHIQTIDRLLKKAKLTSDFDKNILWGTPANVILDMTEDLGSDLIAIGATGRSKLKNLMLGSTAEKIMRYTPCSLLIVR